MANAQGQSSESGAADEFMKNNELNKNADTQRDSDCAAPSCCAFGGERVTVRVETECGNASQSSIRVKGDGTIRMPIFLKGIEKALGELGVNVSLNYDCPSPDLNMKIGLVSKSPFPQS